MEAVRGREADDGECEGSSRGCEEDGADEEELLLVGVFCETLDALAQWSRARHGERGANLLGRFCDVAEGIDVAGRIGSGGDDVVVAGVLALSEEVLSEFPDEGVEPVDEAGKASCEGSPEVTTSEMTELVKEDHAKSVLRPCCALAREVDDGTSETRDARRAFGLAKSEFDRMGELKLSANVCENSELV